MWCIPKLTDKFIERMIDILEIYERPYNPKIPVICFDEKSTQLLAHKRDPLPLKPGMPERYDSEYVRNGTVNLFVAVEPQAGNHHVLIRKQRTGKDFAIFTEWLDSFYTVRHLSGGGVFGILVVSIFKDYSRRLENLSNISYMLGILALMVVSIAPQSMGPDEPPVGILVMAEFVFPIIIVMLTGEVTVRGKESLFVYRKAPSGEARFIKALLLKSWLMAFPITGVVTALITWLTMQVTVGSLIAITGLMVVFVAGYTIFALGLFLLNPAFSEKSMKLWINVMIAMFVAIGLFMASLLILTKGGQVSEPVGGLLLIQGVQSVLSWVVGIIALHLGKRRLQRIE
ncbi:MAG: hypothetical protein HXS48_16750 [Theionarchaea archaeon]|nr:hypothetical protein [Theionarchaea archaeon]